LLQQYLILEFLLAIATENIFSLAYFLNQVDAKPGLLKWRTAVRIRTFGWWRPDLVSLLKVYSVSRSFYTKMLRFWSFF